MTITIPTIYREKENYLETMLKDMVFKHDSNQDKTGFNKLIDKNLIALLIGNEDTQANFYHFMPFFFPYNFYVKHLTPFEWACIKDYSIHIKFNANFARCMTVTKFCDDILYLEDDLEFTNNWFVKLQNAIEILDKDYPDGYVLTLYGPWEFSHNKLVAQIPPEKFYGTQAVYIKKEFQEGIFNKIMEDGIKNYRHMADLLLDEYCRENNIPILCLTTSLVQHIGKESTGLGSYHHTKNFKAD